jgi:predicted O-linked N-acetylglucosamine transferase (SPINDLY family)
MTTDLFADAINRAATQQLDVVGMLDCAEKLKAAGQGQQAADLYKTWIAYNPDHPVLHAVYFNYGVVLGELRDAPGAINAFRAAIRLKPDFYPPYINLGSLLDAQGQRDRAVREWMGLVNTLPMVTGESVNYKTMALKQIGRVLEQTNNDTAAEDALRQSLDINPEQPEVIQHWIALRQRQCKWPVMSEWGGIKRARLSSGISPLSAASFTDDPLFQLGTAFQYSRKSVGFPPKSAAGNAGAVRTHRKSDKLRIGYVSSDLRGHAVGFAMTDVMESHDRRNFEIFAYYCGVRMSDSTQTRIKSAVDHWLDINDFDDAKAADKIREDGIDILVDLNGYTKDARTKVFAQRPAPIAVNWFGYPGTMGTSYHHYIVADPHVIPESHEIYYSEKVLRLPCYQPNDRKRIVADRKPSRRDAGLPETGFVFCSLNGMQKITALTWQRWMTILFQVPGSVLWLLAGTAETNERLRQRATQHGIAPERLVFADKIGNPEHLARYALADLFLDTFPYGSHTTASDAMWMGVPVLTLPGRSFASRVCASLVRAAGIAEMVCATPDEYVARAVALAQDGARLAAIKQRLAAGRDSCRLFDTPALVRDLEKLYRRMSDDLEQGKLPAPDLRNLEAYHEAAIDQDLENIELLSDEAYRSQYRARLAERHSLFPLSADSRLLSAPTQSSDVPSQSVPRRVA